MATSTIKSNPKFHWDKRAIITAHQIGAKSSAMISPSSISISGYKPIYASILPGGYCDYCSVNAEEMGRSGDSVSFGNIYIGNWSDSAVSVNVYCNSLWVEDI